MVLSDPSELRTLVLEQNMANNLEAQSQQSLLLKKTITNSWLRDDYQEDDNEGEEEGSTPTMIMRIIREAWDVWYHVTCEHVQKAPDKI